MNFSKLHWFHLIFGNHTNLFCHAVMVGNQNVKKVERQSASGISREQCAMHATQLFVDRSGVPHAHVECAPCMGRGLTEKVPLFELLVKFFLKGVVFIFLHDIVYIELLYCMTNFELVCTWNKVAVVGNAKKVSTVPHLPLRVRQALPPPLKTDSTGWKNTEILESENCGETSSVVSRGADPNKAAKLRTMVHCLINLRCPSASYVPFPNLLGAPGSLAMRLSCSRYASFGVPLLACPIWTTSWDFMMDLFSPGQVTAGNRRSPLFLQCTRQTQRRQNSKTIASE